MAVTVIVCGITGTNVSAGPDDTTKELMNESVSLLDWGNLRLQLILNRRPYSGNFSYVDYDFDANTINIAHLVERKTTEDEAEKYCHRWFASVREWAGYDSSGELDSERTKYGLFASLYAHNGYIQGGDKDHDARLADLEKKFRLEVRHPLSSGLLSSKQMKCTGTLQGLEIAIATE